MRHVTTHLQVRLALLRFIAVLVSANRVRSCLSASIHRPICKHSISEWSLIILLAQHQRLRPYQSKIDRRRTWQRVTPVLVGCCRNPTRSSSSSCYSIYLCISKSPSIIPLNFRQST
ncbi:hypothetical protein GGR54DRAFT_266815 [Hypoxylon sp. NC1633]|nr:hypothetical protein GGR54DRAFT_266815 [Hypoxylon sp. NC1633]